MALFLGIDGGGSKTACVIGNEAAILGRGAAGGSNLVRLSEAGVREALHSAIRQACAEANVSPSQISRTCIGVAGAGRVEIADRIRAILAEVVGGTIQVVGDMDITMQAAFGDGPGIIVIAGTGSIAFGRNAAGETARAGGWGFAASDEGSGHWIGQQAVRAALRTRDEGTNSSLLNVILRALAFASIDELVVAANASPALNFATLFPAVMQAAEANDRIAMKILELAGTELAALAAIVIKRIFAEQGSVPVAMSGGVFRSSGLVRETFIRHLDSVTVLKDVVDPVEGALALARK
ncbi:MAG TPA: BadF/BadG/BcrA/BcrD ATPase family protein [Terriglobales bacterium]|nr:BadF/BadG/BcrA/BcrD ATPase family protein [Terriglobales bacterium]